MEGAQPRRSGSAYLIERSATAYLNLECVKATFPDVAIHTYNADFITVVPKLSAEIPRDAFAFFFIDPKGWRFDIKQLAPLLSRQKSEVVFNFMFDFVNRAASISDLKIISGLKELMPDGAWQKKLAALDKDSGDVPARRKEILADAFRETLRKLGHYEYVAEVSVLQRLKDRTLYSLFYGTRSVKGIEVFRDWHVKTERHQANVRSHTKRAFQETRTSQLSLFSSDVQLSRDDTAEQLEAEKGKSEADASFSYSFKAWDDDIREGLAARARATRRYPAGGEQHGSSDA